MTYRGGSNPKLHTIMTIGEKITHLRINAKMNQEQLAKALDVTRQSISKWEMDQASPQVDKIIEICKLFHITADDLINDEVVISKGSKKEEAPHKNKYFGTDGFRGESNKVLTADHAYKVGRFLGWYYSKPEFKKDRKDDERTRIVIGKDTRRSSYMFEYALAAGITASGADAYILHVTTTPSVSYITRTDGFACGVMITASHNIFYDNGIKVLNGRGEKLEDDVTALIEAYIDGDMKTLGVDGKDIPYATREEIGSIVDYVSGRNRYTGYLISTCAESFRGMKIGLDCANGASWNIARNVFSALGADIYPIGIEPNGLNTNRDCGSTHIENLCKFVKENKLDVGFAFDGDADRCIAVDEKGNQVDGDKMMYILAKSLKNQGALNNDTVVLTIMSNSGAMKAFKNAGFNIETTAVGDRFVYERMFEKDYGLGGEQSGHVIIRKFATTGDGILTAIKVAEEMVRLKSSLSKLVAPVHLYPQVLKNVRVVDKRVVMEDQTILDKVKAINEKLGDNGRMLLRESGTEPVIRIMVEADDVDLCNELINEVYLLVKKGGYICESN